MTKKKENGIHRGISQSTLKLAAMAAMLFDHAAWVFIEPHIREAGLPVFPQIVTAAAFGEAPGLYVLSYLFHFIGRCAMPLFLFLLSEGITHTGDIRKYAGRLLLFAFLSEIPFDLAFYRTVYYPRAQNVFFTLFLSLCAMYAIRRLHKKMYFALPIAALCMTAAWALRCDYSYRGVLMACVMEILRAKKTAAYCGGCAAISVFRPTELPSLLAAPLVYFYNGKRGLRLQYVFYLFYPVHLILLYFVSRLVY